MTTNINKSNPSVNTPTVGEADSSETNKEKCKVKVPFLGQIDGYMENASSTKPSKCIPFFGIFSHEKPTDLLKKFGIN